MRIPSQLKKFFKGEKGHFAGDLALKTVTEVISAVFGVLTFGLLSRALDQASYAVVNQSIAMSALLAPVILVKINTAYCVCSCRRSRTRRPSRAGSSRLFW